MKFRPCYEDLFLEVRPNILNIQDLKFKKEMLQFLNSETPKTEVVPLLLEPLFGGPT